MWRNSRGILRVDSFRVGIKVTQKCIKLFSDFHSSDVIAARPLGLRPVIEKEKCHV
jgi:Utp25, U3 small nucleolar RNA-associated SSU processome protein 25